MMEPTGYCWECGRPLIKKIFPAATIDMEALFCVHSKCEERYRRKQDAKVIKSRRAGYGVAGSTH
jgi:hypothetical protein